MTAYFYDVMPLNNLEEKFFDEFSSFDFFQAIRVLEKLYPEKTPVGRGITPKDELVKFRGNPSLRFPPSQIGSVEKIVDRDSDQESVEMMVNFMGMIGIAGVLPVNYSEVITDRAQFRDTALWEFTDIFTHRMVSLFYRAWEKYRFPVQYERGNDDFTAYLYDFTGLGTKGLREGAGFSAERLLPYAGLVVQKPRSAVSLSQIVEDYFGVFAKIMQFYGQWLDLDRESITNLAKANSNLGENAIIGTRIWDQQSKFRLVLGPMSYSRFRDFLPNGAGIKPLKSIVNLMTGIEFDFDVQLKLLKPQVPSCILTTRAKRRPMLGWTSWLKSKPFENDDDQVVLQIS